MSRVDSQVVPVILTELAEPKLKVGESWAPTGLDVTAAVSATAPVKPPLGAMATVDEFPVVAPGDTVTGLPLTEKLGMGGGSAVTIICVVPVAPL